MAADPAVTEALGRLPAASAELLRAIGALGAQHRHELWLVGGPVRDLLRGEAHLDVDVAVEGDGPAFARRLAEARMGTAVVHPRFLTATVRLDDLTEVDVATTRRETYERPGALPAVTPAPIARDLARRDFSINAMAVSLHPDRFGTLLDPHGGRPDLGAGVLRVLHARSFEDDPTRILRMARFAARFGFAAEPGTARLAAAAVAAGAFGTVSGDRLREEIWTALDEPDPAEVFRRLEASGALAALLPGARAGGDEFAVALTLAGRVATMAERGPGFEPGLIALLVLLRDATEADALTGASRLGLPPAGRAVLASAPRVSGLAAAVTAATLPSAVDRVLGNEPLELCLAALARLPEEAARERVVDWLRAGRGLRPELDGADLQKMGYLPGPALGAILAALRAARLDGAVADRAAEGRWVRARFRPPDGAPVS